MLGGIGLSPDDVVFYEPVYPEHYALEAHNAIVYNKNNRRLDRDGLLVHYVADVRFEDDTYLQTTYMCVQIVHTTVNYLKAKCRLR